MADLKNIIYIQISAGRGPAECAWVVSQVLKLLLLRLKNEGLPGEVINRNKGYEPGTLNSCVVKVASKRAYKVINPWEGTVQWIGKSPYRKFHKRKNWFVGISVYDETTHISFNERDLVFSTFKATGPGGQHRNKVETAVRVVHKPTNVSVTASDSKSQIQNRKSAIEKVKLALQKYELGQLQQRLDEQWKEHLTLQRGNPVKVFEGRDFKEKKR